MQTSNPSFPESTASPSWQAVSLALALSLGVSAWLNQHSLNRYLEQSYRTESPLAALEQQMWWSAGYQLREFFWATPQSALLQQAVSSEAATTVEQVVQFANEKPQPTPYLEPEEQAFKLEIDTLMYEFVERELSQIAFYDHNLQRPKVLKLSRANEDAKVVVLKTTTPPPEAPPSALSESNLEPVSQSALGNGGAPAMAHLQKGDRVVFMGDSMMQSLAPNLQRWLKEQHGISSTNLARHSTGLTNREYYDWPHEIEKWLSEQNDKSIKMLVVQMGANDPWDIQNGKKHLRFQSPEWEAAYGGRMKQIIQSAHKRHITVVWLGYPVMRTPKYEKKIRYLNDFVLKTAQENGAIPFAVQDWVSPKNTYQDSITIHGKSVRVRNKDGIHLSREGDAYLAEQLHSTLIPQ